MSPQTALAFLALQFDKEASRLTQLEPAIKTRGGKEVLEAKIRTWEQAAVMARVYADEVKEQTLP